MNLLFVVIDGHFYGVAYYVCVGRARLDIRINRFLSRRIGAGALAVHHLSPLRLIHCTKYGQWQVCRSPFRALRSADDLWKSSEITFPFLMGKNDIAHNV